MKNNIVAKIALSFILCLIWGVTSSAAECFRIVSVESGNPCVALKYLEQRGSSTLLYATLTLPDEATEPLLVNLSKKIFVTDGDEDYKLVKAYNIPIEDESMLEYSVLEDNDRKLNFILEFEKFPIDRTFDVVENLSSENSFNFKGIRVDATQKKTVDAKRFTASTNLPRVGRFIDNGAYTTYYDRDGVFVSLHSTYSDDNFTFYLSIVNNSDHGILFNTDKITVTGHRLKGRDSVEVNLPLMSKNRYINLVAQEDAYTANNQSHSAALGEMGSIISMASIGTPWRSPEYNGLRVLGGVIEDLSYSRAKPILAELDKTRGERTKNYLQSQSIKAGESHVGFIRVEKPKKVFDFHMFIHMDGYDFEFYDSIPKRK